MAAVDVDLTLLKTSFDHPNLFADGLRIRDAVCPGWRQRKLHDPGVTAIYVSAALAAATGVRQVGEILQLQWDHLVRRSNARAYLRSMGTDLDPPAAAMATLRLDLAAPEEEDIAVPQWTEFLSPARGERFTSFGENDSIPAGLYYGTVRAVHGTYFQRSLGISPGSAFWKSPINVTNPLANEKQNFCEVLVGPDGAQETYTFVHDYFAFSGPEDRHCVFVPASDGTGFVLFGNGIRGKRPPYGMEAIIRGIAGGGIAGRMGPNEITDMVNPLSASGRAIAITVSNPSETEGGEDAQSVEAAKLEKPHYWRARNMCHGEESFRALSRRVAGVLDARARRVGLRGAYVSIVADTDSGIPTDDLLREVRTYLSDDGRRRHTDRIVVERATLPQIRYQVFGISKSKDVDGVRARALAAIRNFFSLRDRLLNPDRLEDLFGDPVSNRGHVRYSDFIGALEAVPGLGSVLVPVFSRVPVFERTNWSGSATVTAITVTPFTIEEDITITFLGASTYRVDGSLSGPMGRGTLGQVFADTQGRVSFLVAGSGMQLRDTGKIRVGPLAGDQHMQAFECAVDGGGDVSIVPIGVAA